jgi:ribonuclease HI
MKPQDQAVQIYTDGACSGNPGPGGWGAVLIYGDHAKELSGYEPQTTNQRMEIKAAVEALKALKVVNWTITLYSDSAYLVNAYNQKWLEKWQRNGWFNSKKEEVANQDIWQELLLYLPRNTVRIVKVKGHSGDQLNERCDQLAREAIHAGRKAKAE